MTPSSPGLGAEKEGKGEGGGRGERIRTRNNEREALSPSFVCWPVGFHLSFLKKSEPIELFQK